jgi:hypothetical protein
VAQALVVGQRDRLLLRALQPLQAAMHRAGLRLAPRSPRRAGAGVGQARRGIVVGIVGAAPRAGRRRRPRVATRASAGGRSRGSGPRRPARPWASRRRGGTAGGLPDSDVDILQQILCERAAARRGGRSRPAGAARSPRRGCGRPAGRRARSARASRQARVGVRRERPGRSWRISLSRANVLSSRGAMRAQCAAAAPFPQSRLRAAAAGSIPVPTAAGAYPDSGLALAPVVWHNDCLVRNWPAERLFAASRTAGADAMNRGSLTSEVPCRHRTKRPSRGRLPGREASPNPDRVHALALPPRCREPAARQAAAAGARGPAQHVRAHARARAGALPGQALGLPAMDRLYDELPNFHARSTT